LHQPGKTEKEQPAILTRIFITDRNDRMSLEYRRIKAIWYAAMRRCCEPQDASFRYYGGRGILICKRWTGKNGFRNFLSDMGPRPSRKHELDRWPNQNGNYEPGNCRWATRAQQGTNKRSNRFIEWKGRKLTLVDWANELAIPRETIASRLRSGWSIDDALSAPRTRNRSWRRRRITKRARCVTYKGTTRTLAEWARKRKIGAHTISDRLDQGWSVKEAIFTPSAREC
jgi:hypothetical protein